MTPNYKELEERGIDIKKVEEVWKLYNQVLKDVEWYIRAIDDIDPLSLEVDINNFQRIKDILLLP